LVLAAAVAAGVDGTTYTFERPGMGEGDRRLPPRLAGAVSLRHVFVRPASTSDPERCRLFDRHTAGHSIEIDRTYFAQGMWDEIPAEAILLRGGVFEVARGFYYQRFPRTLPAEDYAYRLVADIFQFDRFHQQSQAHHDGLRAYLAWLRQTGELTNVDWRDRLYMEQTIAGWLASTAQALDLFTPELAYPANSRHFLGLVLSLPASLRKSGQHHVDMIRRLAPPLADLPFNPPAAAGTRLRQLAAGEVRDFARYPGKARYVRHRARWAARQVRRLRARED
jgi:hypothetical protein